MSNYETIPLEHTREGDFIHVLVPAHRDGTRVSIESYYHEGPRITITGEFEVSGWRPIPEAPTLPGAVVLPSDADASVAFAIDEDGEWRVIRTGAVCEAAYIEALLNAGTHYVAFEGAEG